MFHTPQFWLFEHIYYGILDTVWLVSFFSAVFLVNKSRFRQHLHWLIPFTVSSSLVFLYRLLANLHYFFRIGDRNIMENLEWALNLTGDFISACGVIILYKTLRSMIQQARADGMEFVPESTPGVWPPPPMRMKE